MITEKFNEIELLHKLRHYLPAQAPLKDFVHHNTLHAFQDLNFHDGLAKATKQFGYKTYLPIREYWTLYEQGKINNASLERTIVKNKGKEHLADWMKKLFAPPKDQNLTARIGKLRLHWKQHYHFDLNGRVHVNVFRMLNSYLDQGIAIWSFPEQNLSLLEALQKLEKNSFTSFFRTKRAKNLLLSNETTLSDLLKILVGDESLFEQYIFDQQFEHPGWSGLIATIEDEPHTLLDSRKISLKELILIELLLEIDTLDHRFGENWLSLDKLIDQSPEKLFDKVVTTELDEINKIWQEAYEWSYYDDVIVGLQSDRSEFRTKKTNDFQALFCIDDREIGLRQHIENVHPACETFGTPGHFGIDTYYQPENGKFYTKICPLPITPKHVICEIDTTGKNKRELHFNNRAHGLFGGWLISQSLGFWSALKLMLNVFKPSISPASATSFGHMDQFATLTVENKDLSDKIDHLQVGYTIEEMTDRVQNVLTSIGLIENFASLIYVIGHGASSTNNPHYAAYDCGACCGRPGSVNARAFSFMANHEAVRQELQSRGITIPSNTKFVGGLHDTTRDDFHFYDIEALADDLKIQHEKNQASFAIALDLNAKERSRRFDLLNSHKKAKEVHKKIQLRAVSLFEPRPEYNHATNSLCVVGRRTLTQDLFLDRRAFLNSYDYAVDPTGRFLAGILAAATPVCGGINLEYYFSRVDNHKLGAGSKLPHNVMGLIGVANGIEGDLRPGLPQQMIEIHDPIRLLMIVEQLPEVVLDTLKSLPNAYQWYEKEWVNLVVIHPINKSCYRFENGEFNPYNPLATNLPTCKNLENLVESTGENIAVTLLKPELVW